MIRRLRLALDLAVLVAASAGAAALLDVVLRWDRLAEPMPRGHALALGVVAFALFAVFAAERCACAARTEPRSPRTAHSEPRERGSSSRRRVAATEPPSDPAERGVPRSRGASSARGDRPSRREPWWRKAICLHVVDWLIGRARYEQVDGEPFEALVPMPEGSYRAIAQPRRSTWCRRWYWPQRTETSVWLTIPGGIPHAGKGESSWDCGDDGLFGVGGATLEDAIANAIRSSLRSRHRHGHDSKGTGTAAAVIVNGPRFETEASGGEARS